MNAEAVFPAGDSEFDALYAEEAAMVDASELIAAALEVSGMSKTELANALGVNKSEISARLAGERNITVRKLAATLHVLGQRLELATTDLADGKRANLHRYDQWRSAADRGFAEPDKPRHTNIPPFGEWKTARRA